MNNDTEATIDCKYTCVHSVNDQGYLNYHQILVNDGVFNIDLAKMFLIRDLMIKVLSLNYSG